MWARQTSLSASMVQENVITQGREYGWNED